MCAAPHHAFSVDAWAGAAERHDALAAYQILDTPAEVGFDRAARLAARLFQVPLAAVTFIDSDRQWFKACVGADIRENPLSGSFSQALVALDGPDVLVVPNALEDERFRSLAVVSGPMHLRFYAGAALKTPQGVKIGTLCLFDVVPRADLTATERATLQDLADQVASELELRRALLDQARERKVSAAILNAALDAMIVLDAQGRITEWNPAAEAMLGYSRREALGQDLTEVMVPSQLHATHREGIRTAVAQRDLSKHRAVLPALRRSGEPFSCEFTLTPFEVEGDIMFTVYVRDLTETLAARDALDASHKLLRAVVDSVPESIYVKDAGRRYTMINAAGAAQIGRPVTEILGRTDEDLFPAETARESRARDEAVLTSGHARSYEVTDLLASGSRRTYWAAKKLATDTDGGLLGLVGVAVDITERKAAEVTIRTHNDALTARVEAAQLEILKRLARAAEYRDDDTGEHMNRVAHTAAGIAQELGLPEAQVNLIARTAPLHDVGKIGISDTLLLKPGRLTPEEFELVKTHALIGATILAGGHSPMVLMAEEIARTHHERWDGTGYPRGLKGQQIPISGRIVAVADVLDALTSERPYKKAWTLEAALTEIQAQSGRHFDPQVVAALCRFLEQHPQAV